MMKITNLIIIYRKHKYNKINKSEQVNKPKINNNLKAAKK